MAGSQLLIRKQNMTSANNTISSRLNSKTESKKIAVIGGGHLGRIHSKLLVANPEFQLIAVADPFAPSRVWIEQNQRVPTVEDYRDLEGVIDAAVIAAPTVLHHEIGMWCLKHNIHVLIEKPISASLAEGAELIEQARRSDRILQVGHVERFNPAWNCATQPLTSDSIRFIEAAREGTYTGRSTDISIVMDLMIHDIDLILSKVQSPVIKVEAYGWPVLGEFEDFAVAHLAFENGCIAQLRASRVSPTPRRNMQIFAEESVTDIDFATNKVTSTTALPDVLNKTRQADTLPPEQRAKVKDELFEAWLQRCDANPTPCNAIEQEHFDFARAIQSNSAPRVDGRQALDALEIAVRIEQRMRLNTSMHPGIIPSADRFSLIRKAS